jgi:long-chain acyl-CoA synthetase
MLYHEIIEHHPAEAPALIFNDVIINYAGFRQRVKAWAAFLQEKGLQKGEKVGLLSKNCSEFVIAYFAVIKAGGVIVPFNYQLAMPEVAYILQDSQIRFLISTSEVPVQAAMEEIGYNVQLQQFRYGDLDAGDAAKFKEVPEEENENCTIIYTSGTTGKPKGAMLSHRNLVENAKSYCEAIGVHQGDHSLCVLPMYHCFGWTCSVTGPLYMGGCIVAQQVYAVAKAVELIQKYKVDIFCGVPTMMQMLLDDAKPEELARVRFFFSGGASLPQKVSKDFTLKFGCPVQEGYGLSETSPVVSLTPRNLIKVGSIGRSITGVEVEIRDEHDQKVPVGVVGELCVKGPNVMLGYLNKPEATAEAMRGGWFHTGDMAYEDEDACYFIVDRLKDMIIAAGENIYPREIEELMYHHPAVKEVAVVGVPDKLRGQAVAAYVVLRDGMTATKPELRKFIKGKVANYKLPKYFVFMDQLPKNNTGKILKRALRERGIEDMVNRVART